MKKYLAIIYLVFNCFYSKAQHFHQIDSLKKLINKESNDTLNVDNLNAISVAYLENNPAKCDSFANAALYLAIKINYYKGIGKSYYLKGYNLLLSGSFNEALENFYKSEEAFLKAGDKKGLASVYSQIGNVCWSNKNFDKAITFHQKALFIQKQINDKAGMAGSYNNLGVCHYNKKEFDEAIIFFKDALEIKIELKDEQAIANTYNNIAGIYVVQKKYQDALIYCENALESYKKNNDINSIAFMNINIGELYKKLKEYKKALKSYNEGLKYALEIQSLSIIRNAYKEISETYDSIRDYRNAYANRLKYESYNDTIYNQRQSETFADMQTKYEMVEKERKIAFLEKENELKNVKINQTKTVFISIGAVSVFALIILFLLIYFHRQKQNRKKLILRILETEEKERSYFAAELHDGLGPLLSAISMYIDVMSNDKTEPEKKAKLISDTDQLIQDAIQTAKSIANKLTPSILKDYGLAQAIEVFCRKINLANIVKINIHDKTYSKRYHEIIETACYRIVLELINNTLKYAKARNIIIDMDEKHGLLIIDYKDDGLGCNLQKAHVNNDSGLGLKNIKNRVFSINGKIKFKSAIDKGFATIITVPV